MHFTRMGGFDAADVPIIVRGDGCHLEDSNGRRYIDALAGLFSVNIGYSFGDEIGQAALDQMRELPFYTNWSYAHPRAIELAAEVASLAPGDLNRVFFCSGGSEAVESAWKLARQYYTARGDKHSAATSLPALVPARRSARSSTTRSSRRRRRRLAATRRSRVTSPTTARRWARSRSTASRRSALRSSRSSPRFGTSRNTNRYHRPAGRDRGGVHAVPPRRARAGDRLDGAGDGVPRAHGARAERRRLLHAARGLLARRARDLRPLRHPALGRRGHHRLRPRRLLVRLRAVRHPARTSSRARRGSPRRTPRSARWSRRTR